MSIVEEIRGGRTGKVTVLDSAEEGGSDRWSWWSVR
jgi:hypothetical protein